jgi:iron complex outermembrane receptor protein
VTQPDYAQLSANIGWSPLNSGLKVKLWGKNLTNKAVLQSLVNTTAYDTVTYSPPRAFGIDVSYNF